MPRPPAVVLMTFAGRRDRMALLDHYANQALRRGIVDEWHVWDFARDPQDRAWLQSRFPAIRRTADDRIYRPTAVHLPPTAAQTLRLDLRAAHDAHIALLGQGGGPSYELVLGGWGNSAVALRVWAPGTPPDHARSPPPPELVCAAPALFSGRRWRAVEVRMIRAAGALSIVLLVDGRDVLRFDTPEAAPRPFGVAVMTGYGGVAEWRLRDDGPARSALFYATPDLRHHPWNPVYDFYSSREHEYPDTVFLKCDDDIVYLDVDRLADFIRFRRARPDYFLVSANVLNNGVCAHVQQRLGMVPPELMTLEMPPGGFRGSLWSSGAKGEALHRWFLSNPARFRTTSPESCIAKERLSINFVSWLGADLPHLNTRFTDDEHDLTVTLPRFLGRENAIYLPFLVSHLSFRPQDSELDVASILGGYRALASPACTATADDSSRLRAVPP